MEKQWVIFRENVTGDSRWVPEVDCERDDAMPGKEWLLTRYLVAGGGVGCSLSRHCETRGWPLAWPQDSSPDHAQAWRSNFSGEDRLSFARFRSFHRIAGNSDK